ncbi:hypothetical protein VHEMI04136 [[Torrubiella] hemipterigena]|uniref:peptidylprolyl isomerase n=1 Tax=[Torrubiella] hemipterigena TaxID=1531966 RepID=A0A0A1TD14_9HYPO|nr:hypothetical protein VHEMI04136 [[Torrubiella] hemipterigena]
MRVSAALAFVATLLSGASAHVCTDKVAVVVTNPAPSCGNSASNGDTLFVNYNLTLLSTFKQVDSSDGTPFNFTLGKGQVIKGFDWGLKDTCVGETRTIMIPPEYGYGNKVVGPIPANSTLIFSVELVKIE